MDAVPSQMKEDYIRGYYIEAPFHKLPVAAGLWNFAGSMPVESVPVA